MTNNAKWTEEFILNMIKEGVEEDLHLDYKSCDSLLKTDSKKKELSKDVSAFANSDGGTLIYGVKEDGNKPSHIDVGYDPSDITKEWIEQVINSKINRKIDGILITPVYLYSTDPTKCIYVVEIPKSNRAPHMASDNRYYKRYNFESVPMEDYEVRDVANREKKANLKLSYLLKPNGTSSGSDGTSYALSILVGIENIGKVIAKQPAVKIKAGENLNINESKNFKKIQNTVSNDGVFLVGDGISIYPKTVFDVVSISPNLKKTAYHKGYIETKDVLEIGKRKDEVIFSFDYEIYSENGEQVIGKIEIKGEEIFEVLKPQIIHAKNTVKSKIWDDYKELFE